MAGHDHGVAIQHTIEFSRAAPQHSTIPPPRSFIGKERAPRSRMHPIAGDEQPTFRFDGFPSRAIYKLRADKRADHGEAREFTVQMHTVGSNALFGGLQQRQLKDSSMNRNLRPSVAGGKPPRLAPNALAAFREIRQFSAGDTRALDRSA